MYEALFEQTYDGLAVFDLQGHCTQVNPQTCTMLGYQAQEFMGMTFGQVSVEPERAQTLFRKLLADGTAATFECGLRRKSGPILHVEATATLVRNADGQPTRVQLIIRDVTERRRAQIELADQNRMLRTLIDSLPDFVYVKDLENRFVADNEAHARSTGRTVAEVVGKTDYDLYPNELAERYVADGQRVMDADRPLLNYEEPCIGKEGEPIWALTSKIPLHDSEGKIVGLVGVTRDITQRKQHEKQLEESERFIQKITAAIPDVLFVYDFEAGIYRYSNSDAIYRALGYAPEEFARRDLSFLESITHPDDIDNLHRWYDRFKVLGDDDVLETTYRLLHKNGEWRRFYSRDRVFARNAEGAPTQSLGISQDITEVVLVEQRLRRQNEYLRALSEITLALINRLDPSDIMRTVLARTKALMQTEYVYIDMVSETPALTPGFIRIQRFEGETYEVRPGEGVIGRVCATAETVVVEDYGNWPYRVNASKLSDVRASIGIPLRSKERLVGSLGVSYTDSEHSFEAAEIDILNRIGELASIALDNAQLFAAAQRELAERERVEAALRASEARYRAVVESQTEMICCFAPDNTVTFVNDAYCRYFDVRREDILGKTLPRRIPEEDWSRMEPVLNAQFRGEMEVAVYEHRVVTPSGETRWQQWIDRVIKDEQGKIVELQGVGRDVTERKVAELALNAERDFVSAIVGNTVALLTVSDREGRIVTFNGACEALSGYRFEEVEGQKIWDRLILPEEVELVKQVFASVCEGHYPNQNINSWVARDGKTRLIEWSNTALTDEHGEVTHIVSSGVDISARQQLEERNLELALEREKVKMLGNFVRDASHDFRTPLSILNTALYLMRRSPGAEVFEPRLLEMEHQVSHLTRLIDQLLTMTRLDSGTGIKLAQVVLNDIVQMVAASLQASTQEKDQQMTVRLAEDLPPVLADVWQLNQALRNVGINAVQYTPRGGSVMIETARENRSVVIRISDTGVGIEPADLPHVFDRFYRADKARTGGEAGAGLGLAITRKILELHQGDITASSAPGQGAVFTIRLPIMEAVPSRNHHG
jgi:PAS domain S-box-containing protein